MTLTITPVNDNTPAAQADSGTVLEGGTLTGAVTATDDDSPNDTLTFAKVSDPVHGTLTFNADGTYTYVHDGGENFSDSFAYEVTDAAGHTSQATVTLTITPVNDNTPVAQAATGTLLEGGTLIGAVSATDADEPNDTLTFTKVSEPAHGTLTFNADGTYTYVHDGSENFSDSFAYEVTDAAGHTSQATVTLTITPVNDNTPVAQAATGTLLEGGTLIGAVSATDADAPNDTLTFTKGSDPAHGTLTFHADGTYTYVHDGSENFSDSFAYEVTDAAGHTSQATVTLTITPVNENTPVAQAATGTLLEGGTLIGAVSATDADAANDTLTFTKGSDPAHGTLTFHADGTYTYVHDGSENFSDSFMYEVTDAGGHKSQATVTLTVTPVNDNTPLAQAGSESVLEGGTLTGAVTATDADSPNDTLTFAKVTDPVHGTLTFNADGTYTYVHDGSENFGDSFMYEVTDVAGHKSQATVMLTITPVNDNTPAAQAGSETVLEGGTLTGAVTATDADAPNDSLAYAKVTDPAHGTLTFSTDGTYTYVHDGSENFSDSFSYKVTDAAGHTSRATVSLTITPVNDNTPVAQAGSKTVLEGGSLNGAVTATDADSPNDTLTFAKVSNPAHGTLTFHGDGTYLYVHDGSESFSDVFTYEVTDAAGHKSQATVTLTITPVNDNAPVAQTATGTLLEGGTLTGAVAATDADAPNDTLAFAKVSGPAHGALAFQADGTYTYVHDGSENFGDAFTYQVSDAAGHASQATVTLTITPVNDNAPIAQDGTATVDEGGSVAGAVTATDADAPNDTLTFALVTGPAHGTLALHADGSYSYTHDGSETTADRFTFRVTDAAGASSEATVTLAITPVDDPSVLSPDAAQGVEDEGPVTGNVLANDRDVDTPLQVATFRIGDTDYVAGSTAQIPGVGAFTLATDGRFRFDPAPDWNGTVPTIGYSVSSGAGSSLTLTIAARNDAPTRAAPAPGELTVLEGSSATPLGFAGVGYGPGGGSDEAGQVLTVTVTTLPSGIGRIVLADGRTEVVVGGAYTIDQLHGMQFVAAAGVSSGDAGFAFTVADDQGGTLDERMAVRVVNQAPTLAGTNALPTIAEDTVDAAGMSVADLIAGHAGDPSGHYGIAVIAAQGTGGTWEFTRDGGATWRSFDGVSERDAELLAADSATRIRFVPAADWNGEASGLLLRAWDGSDGTNAKRADASVHGGSTAFSSDVAQASIRVEAVNDAPRATGPAVSGLVVTAGTASDPLLPGGMQYEPGGGGDEAGQALTVTMTAMPPASAGRLVLADGTTVVYGASYTLEQFRGVRYVPATDAGAGVVDIRWVVQDDGGTQAGGVDSTPGAMRIEVAAAPVAPAPAPQAPVDAAPTPAPAPVPAPAAQPAPAPTAPLVVAPAPAAPAPAPAASVPLPAADASRVVLPVATALAEAPTGFAQSLQFAQDSGHVPPVALDLRDLRLVAFNPANGEFAITGFTASELAANRITVQEFQQTLRGGAFVEELNRLRKQLHDEFDIDRTVRITVAGLSLGASVLYVLWLIRGGVLLGSYLSALPAWRLLDPLPVLARAGDDEDEDDEEAFAPADDRGPDPLRGFA